MAARCPGACSIAGSSSTDFAVDFNPQSAWRSKAPSSLGSGSNWVRESKYRVIRDTCPAITRVRYGCGMKESWQWPVYRLPVAFRLTLHNGLCDEALALEHAEDVAVSNHGHQPLDHEGGNADVAVLGGVQRH